MGDIEGALGCYKLIRDRIGLYSSAEVAIRRLEAKMRPRPQATHPRRAGPLAGPAGSPALALQEILKRLPPSKEPKAFDLLPPGCSECGRVGIKLSTCAGCGKLMFCSRACQKASWNDGHKFLCKGSKSKLEGGMQVRIKGLTKATHLNGKIATVTRFIQAAGRFEVYAPSSEGGGQKISVKPQNLEKV